MASHRLIAPNKPVLIYRYLEDCTDLWLPTSRVLGIALLDLKAIREPRKPPAAVSASQAASSRRASLRTHYASQNADESTCFRESRALRKSVLWEAVLGYSSVLCQQCSGEMLCDG